MHLSSSCVTAGNTLLTGERYKCNYATQTQSQSSLGSNYTTVTFAKCCAALALKKEHNLTRLDNLGMYVTFTNCCLDLITFRKKHTCKIL